MGLDSESTDRECTNVSGRAQIDRAAVAVLVVDDNPDFLQVAQAVLGERGSPFAVYTVQTGTGALAFLEGSGRFAGAPRPRFVVLDFHLPDMDAPAVLQALRARPHLRDIPVLVLSQADWVEDERAVRAAGARGFLVKPSRVRPLRAIMLEFWKEECADGSESVDRRGQRGHRESHP
jgi:CheY-like chemotaxis protein